MKSAVFSIAVEEEDLNKKDRVVCLFFLILLLVLTVSCRNQPENNNILPESDSSDSSADPQPVSPLPTQTSTIPPENESDDSPTETISETLVDEVSFSPGEPEDLLYLDQGGDVDTREMEVGEPAQTALRSGNGTALPAGDGNMTGDSYIQFQVDDSVIFQGNPTSRVVIEVEYLDAGTDSFNIQYDAVAGTFSETGAVFKTDSGEIRTAHFSICDAYFGNRDNGADFRLTDFADGAETIFSVTVRLLPESEGAVTVQVDSCGANPFDDQPDSDAIQTCVDQMCSGDTAVFSSPGDSQDYVGYLIDKTIFLLHNGVKTDLTFTSSNESNHALLQATADLKGFVVMLYARSRVAHVGLADNITFTHLDVDSNRAERVCFGANLVEEGEDDSWGSWLPECDVLDDAWCAPGGIALNGGIDDFDPWQDFEQNPARWTTGLVVEDVVISNVECGTALGFIGAAGRISNVTIDTAGDHIHKSGCQKTDPDEPVGGWSDGMTIVGPKMTITHNTVINPSDIGIVHFGGRDSKINFNTIISEQGNYGAFAGIALHPWSYGITTNYEIIGNSVINQSDGNCGGLHTGINIGGQMWNIACTNGAPSAIGNINSCSTYPEPPGMTVCGDAASCQVWVYVPEESTFTLKDNTVTGAHISYLIGGVQFEGEFINENNVSITPRSTCWEDANGCYLGGIYRTYPPADFVAFNPTIDGWIELEVYCTR